MERKRRKRDKERKEKGKVRREDIYKHGGFIKQEGRKTVGRIEERGTEVDGPPVTESHMNRWTERGREEEESDL